ncbi:MAG: NTP transferase domain-containing protein [Steroidobacteraceae bacterium]
MTALNGLVLAGGRSSRMQADKAALAFGRLPQLAQAYELLLSRVDKVWISVRPEQRNEPLRAAFPQVVDGALGEGPIAGIIAAQAQDPAAAWLVLACDLPLLDGATLDQLIAGRDPARLATAFRSTSNGLPEPLCAIYEPACRSPVLAHVAAGRHCPRRFLLSHDIALLDASLPHALDNANTPEDFRAMRSALTAAGPA